MQPLLLKWFNCTQLETKSNKLFNLILLLFYYLNVSKNVHRNFLRKSLVSKFTNKETGDTKVQNKTHPQTHSHVFTILNIFHPSPCSTQLLLWPRSGGVRCTRVMMVRSVRFCQTSQDGAAAQATKSRPQRLVFTQSLSQNKLPLIPIHAHMIRPTAEWPTSTSAVLYPHPLSSCFFICFHPYLFPPSYHSFSHPISLSLLSPPAHLGSNIKESLTKTRPTGTRQITHRYTHGGREHHIPFIPTCPASLRLTGRPSDSMQKQLPTVGRLKWKLWVCVSSFLQL